MKNELSSQNQVNVLVPIKNGIIDRSRFNAQSIKKFEVINSNLDNKDTNSILNYGLQLQNKLANYSDEFLSNIRALDTGEIGTSINSLLNEINHVDAENSGNFITKTLLKLPGGKKLFNGTKKMLQKYDNINNNVSTIVTSLDKGRLSILKDNNKLQSLFDKNLQFINELEDHIIAGHIKLEDLKGELNTLRDSGKYEAYEISDAEDFINRLSKRLMDMELTRTITIQTLPQIRMVQNNNATMAEKIQSSITTTIPIWKNQISLAVAMNRQQSMIAVQNKVYETTNEILSKNSELLKSNSTEVAKQNERSVVDIETIKKVNQDLVNTLSDIKKIKEEGDSTRENIKTQLIEIENELKNVILK